MRQTPHALLRALCSVSHLAELDTIHALASASVLKAPLILNSAPSGNDATTYHSGRTFHSAGLNFTSERARDMTALCRWNAAMTSGKSRGRFNCSDKSTSRALDGVSS
jgi:hypothetical protein